MGALAPIVALLFALLGTECLAGRELVRLPELSCEPSAPTCFEEARKLLGTATDPLSPFSDFRRALPPVTEVLPRGNSRSMSFVPPRRAPGAVVLIHGLWGSTEQFRHTAEELSRQGLAVIVVTLPGHGGQWERGKEVRAEDWLEETRRAVRLAAALGEKVIIGGQSTGGMLSIMAALDRKNPVNGVVLLEPAIRVETKLTLGSCVGRQFVDQAGDVPKLTRKFIDLDPCRLPMPIFFSLGCEVSKLRDLALERYLAHALRDVEGGRVSDDELSRELGELVQLPAVLIDNPRDEIVSSRDNQRFLEGLKKTAPFVASAEVPVLSHGALSPERLGFGTGVVDVLKRATRSDEQRASIARAAELEASYRRVRVQFLLRRAWLKGLDPKGQGELWPFETKESLSEFSFFVSGALLKIAESKQRCEDTAWCAKVSRWEKKKDQALARLEAKIWNNAHLSRILFLGSEEVEWSQWLKAESTPAAIRDARAAIREFHAELEDVNAELDADAGEAAQRLRGLLER
ncbi:MAG: alpha/beta fold hydrolase [Oligoflexia bacterium]|nr:alpha/beta fold hydrolase [Oligoflexia bacterium]